MTKLSSLKASKAKDKGPAGGMDKPQAIRGRKQHDVVVVS